MEGVSRILKIIFYHDISLSVFTTPSPPSVTSTISTGPGITSTTSSTSEGGGGSGEGALCSDPNGLYAHSTDCQKYYQCAHGTPYEYSCPAALLWNDDIKVCDWPANVRCTPGILNFISIGISTI